MADFDAAHWDARYAASPSVWGGAPNRFVEQELADVRPGRALDVACGEGRNAIWLARRGWSVLAVDFSVVALDKGRAAEPAGAGIEWLHTDAVDYRPAAPVDLVLICYLQVPEPDRRAVLVNAAAALTPGGTLLVVAHDVRNLTEGTGGPKDPAVLWSPDEVRNVLSGHEVVVERAETVTRPVDGATRPALDTVVRAHRRPPVVRPVRER